MDDAQRSALRVRALRHGLERSRFAVLHQTPDLVYTLAENLPASWPAQDPVGHSDLDTLPPELAAQIAPIRAAVLEGYALAKVEVAVPGERGRDLLELTATPDRDETGELFGILTTIRDVTDKRGREVALASLLREVSHRSKNLLAIVQSVAMQTAFHAGSIEDFLEKFRGRLQALASSQDLVTNNNWRGTHFQSLVLAQLAKSGRAAGDPLHLRGDDPMLGPNAALHVGLAMHELLTNATLHGALSGRYPGRVDVAAEVDIPATGEPALTITWTESHPEGEILAPPRFGTLVLEQIVPRSLGGSAQFDLGRNHVTYRLSVPADQFMV